MYLLTNCAACAAPLALDAPKCVRCATRYCNVTCQHDHWRRGHKQICKKIHRGGNAEQYHADKKYSEAVAVAVEACAVDTKGQTCYICKQALHWKTKEGLVRGCACRGTAGCVHVACLAEQAKILVAEAEESSLGYEAFSERFERWRACPFCEQEYRSVVCCALGWACRKTYMQRAVVDIYYFIHPTARLAYVLYRMNRVEDARAMYVAVLDRCRATDDDATRPPSASQDIIETLGHLTMCDRRLGREDDLRADTRELYDRTRAIYGRHEKTYSAAYRYGVILAELHYVRDALEFLREVYPHAKADLGERHKVFIGLMHVYFFSLWLYHLYGYEGYRDHLTRAVRGLIYILARSQDVNGNSTRQTRQIEHTLCRVLTHQLDWSLDDLPLDDIERQIVDTLLAEVPAPGFTDSG